MCFGQGRSQRESFNNSRGPDLDRGLEICQRLMTCDVTSVVEMFLESGGYISDTILRYGQNMAAYEPNYKSSKEHIPQQRLHNPLNTIYMIFDKRKSCPSACRATSKYTQKQKQNTKSSLTGLEKRMSFAYFDVKITMLP